MKRNCLVLVLTTLCAAVSPGLSKEIPCPGCNVILVAIDVFRADELTYGGSAKVIMPHLEAMAAQGAVFSNAYSPSSGSTPADLSILSGLYQWHHQVDVPLRDKPKMDEWAKSGRTLPTLLRNRGYEVYTGDLASSDDLNRILGRELAVAGKSPSPQEIEKGGKFFLLLRGALHDPYFPDIADVQALEPGVDLGSVPTVDDVQRCDFAALLARKAPRSMRFPRDGTEFWFLNQGDRAAVDRILESEDPRARLDAVRGWNPALSNYTLNSQCFWSFFSSSTIPTARLLYDASARRLDRVLGDVLDGLAAKGLLKNTLIVVTSQHGEAFLEHGYINHSSQLNTEVLRVPLIMSAPFMKGGRVVPSVVRSIDIMPTILDAIGERGGPDMDGRSLLPCLTKDCPDRVALSYYERQYGIRDGRYSFLSMLNDGSGGSDTEELYDERADPKEQRNLAHEDPKTAARYRALLEKSIKYSDLAGIRNGTWPDWVDGNMREQIIRTGYW